MELPLHKLEGGEACNQHSYLALVVVSVLVEVFPVTRLLPIHPTASVLVPVCPDERTIAILQVILGVCLIKD